MKKILFIITVFIFSTIIAKSQTSFHYQAVFRDSNDKPYTNTNIDLRFTILYGSSSGTVVFSEKHSVVSSTLGIVVANVGEGTNISGNIANIDWSQGKYYLKVDADINITGNFEYFGTNIISRVPTAVYADKCGNVDDADADPGNEIQTLNFDSNSNQLSISNGNTVTIPTVGTDADADPSNEIQVLTKTGNTVTLSKNGGTFTDAVKDEDSDTTNEIQQLHYDYMTNDFWIDGGQDTFHDSGSDIWDLVSTLEWPPGLNTKWGVANYPIVLNNFSADTQSIKHIDISGDIWFESDFPNSAILHLWNENIHFDSIDGDFIIEPFGIYSFSTPNNKGFRLNNNELTFNEYFGAEFKPIEINRNFGIKMRSDAGFKTVDISNQNGDISLFKQNGSKKIGLGDILGSGDIRTYNNQQNAICYLTNSGTNHDHGYIAVGNQNGSIKAGMIAGNNDGGELFVLNKNGLESAGMYIDNNDKGHIYADIKNFIMPDPENEENMIMYASLEGPEAAAYDRGRGILKYGKAFISFKDHFKKVVNTKNTTIQLTPMSSESKGLAVVEITKEGFWVQELYQGTGSYYFFWEAKGVRIGFEDYKVSVPKSYLNLKMEPKQKISIK